MIAATEGSKRVATSVLWRERCEVVNKPEGSSTTRYLPRELELSRFDVEREVAVLDGPEADVRWIVGIIETKLRRLVKLARHLSDVLRRPELGTHEFHYGNTIMSRHAKACHSPSLPERNF